MNIIKTDVRYAVGLDLGQRRDYSGIAVIEREDLTYDVRDPVTYSFKHETRFRLRHIERIALGTQFTAIAAGIRTLVEAVTTIPGRFCRPAPCNLIVDATGVGIAILEIIRAAKVPCTMVPVTITGADRETQEKGEYRVPKRDLIVGLQVAVESEKIIIAQSALHSSVLLEELMNMQSTITSSGHQRFEAWRSGDHDDLVLATSLAWWWMRKAAPVWHTAA